MTRVKRGVTSHRRHKTILERTKGHHGQRHRLIKRAHESMLHALRYNYVDRKDRKGDFRELWIMRINAAARLNGLSYSRLIHGLALAGIDLDRKALADLAVTRPDAFAQVTEQAKAAIANGGTAAARDIRGTGFTVSAGSRPVAVEEGTAVPSGAAALATATPVALAEEAELDSEADEADIAKEEEA